MRTRLTAAATAVMLVVTLVSVPSAPARAKVNVADDLHTEYDGCIGKFTASGLRDLVDQLDKSPREFVFKRSKYTITTPDSTTSAGNGKGSGGTTKWNPTDTSPFEGDGVRADPCATLYHEMSHLADYDKGTNRRDPCIYMKDGKPVNTGISAGEVKAVRKENAYRAAQKPPLPPRTTYGKGTHLPPPGTECQPKPPERPSGGCNVGCAIGAGDPHLKTFDEYHYDFQAVGEFILTRATRGDALEVQGRTHPVGSRTASLFSAVAMNVGGDRVSVYRLPARLRIHLAGAPIDVPVGTRNLPKGGALEVIDSSRVAVRWPDGSSLQTQAVGNASIRLSLRLAEARRGAVEGLFGNFDGRGEGDLVVRGGAAIGDKPSFETLYQTFGQSWRITQAQSLFDYGPGESTATFTDRSYPDRRVTAVDLPNRATAEAICRRAGVTEPRTLEDCILDVGLTGELAYAHDALTTQLLVGPEGTTVLSVTQPGAEARLSFRGARGQKVFIDAPTSTLPDGCSPLELRDAAGKRLGSGCIIDGKGFIDTTTLPTDGQFTVALNPRRATGQASVRVITVNDQEMSVDATDVRLTSTISQPGAVTRFRFTGRAGQAIFLDVPGSTLPDDCSPLELRDNAGKVLASGCVINGRGYVDRTELPANGEYTILVDPRRDMVGVSQLRLVTAIDETKTISLDGPPVVATIGQPGAITRLTFTGTAGQRVMLEATSSSLPDDCSPLELRDSADRLVASGCIIGGDGQIRATVLPTTGRYAIVLDPSRAATGTAELRLRRAS
jgi:hypothetical protein